MRSGAIIRIPDAVEARRGEKVVAVQPGLPGRWSIWSQAAGTPGAHFAVPADDESRALGIKHVTVRIVEPQGETARIKLIDVEPATAMPKVRQVA